MKKKSFIVRLENMEQLNMLNDEQCGRLLKALCRYAGTGQALVSDDPILALAFSFFKGQIDRDTEKYDEMCRRNSENGKKGGAPKGNTNASKNKPKQPKTTECYAKQPKTSLPECDSDSECDPEPDPDSECECERDARTAQGETQHTAHSTQPISLSEIIALAKRFGCDWDMAEAKSFLAYNIDKGRTGDWGFAVQKWEEHREEHNSRRKKNTAASDRAQEKMQGYLSTVNRFKEKGENDGSDT